MQGYKLVQEFTKNPEKVRVELDNHRGRDVINVKVFCSRGEEWIPTQNGLTLSVELITSLNEALAKANKVMLKRFNY
ncbi:MAG: PC4/YdbC family ssDNA-binding protein [Candidatus Aminicenantaceae bacterium]